MQSQRQDNLGLLLDGEDAALGDEVALQHPGLFVILPAQLKQHPQLWERVNVAYGGLEPDQLSLAPNLRWLQLYSAGANKWLTPKVKSRGILVTNASGIHAQPITEHMFGMLLAVTRCLPQAWEQQKTAQWRGYDFNGHLDLLAGKTLGVLGAGSIGQQAARVGQAFGMRVIGLRRGSEPLPFMDEMFTPATRLQFFARSQVIMNILPGTEQTRGFMGRGEFDALPQGAILVNAGRGSTIDTNALLDSLNFGRLKAALLDVTDPEPLPPDHPLWRHPNVFITPHYSGGHPGYQRRANKIFLENLRRFLRGEPLLNLVDTSAGY